MNPHSTTEMKIRLWQRQARENFAQSQVKDHLVMQQSARALDKSPLLQEYESRLWPVRQFRDLFSDGAARRAELVQYRAATQTLRGLAHADKWALQAVKVAIQSDTQRAQGDYFKNVLNITNAEIQRIGREQSFINRVENEARHGFEAAYEALLDDLRWTPSDTGEALELIAARLALLAQLNEDNKREFASQLGGPLAVKAADIAFILQSMQLAYGCAHDCLTLAGNASTAALAEAKAAAQTFNAQLRSGSWHASIPERGPSGWRSQASLPTVKEQALRDVLGGTERQEALIAASYIVDEVTQQLDMWLDADAQLAAARSELGGQRHRADIELMLRDAVADLGALAPAPTGQDLDTWLGEAATAVLPVYQRRAQRTLVDTIVLLRMRCVQLDAAPLALSGMLEPVSFQVFADAQAVLCAIDSLRQAPLHRLPDLAVALDTLEAQLLQVAARAATSPLQFQLVGAIPEKIAAQALWVERALTRSNSHVQTLLGDFRDTEWDLRAYYMRTARTPETLERTVIYGEADLQLYGEDKPQLRQLVQLRYENAIAKHLRAHPGDEAAWADYVKIYGEQRRIT